MHVEIISWTIFVYLHFEHSQLKQWEFKKEINNTSAAHFFGMLNIRQLNVIAHLIDPLG